MAPLQGSGLGRGTMPQTLHYSTVCGIQSMWLAATVLNIGIGWVSIIDPQRVEREFACEASWSLTALLCVGWPEEYHRKPELERFGWAHRDPGNAKIWSEPLNISVNTQEEKV